MGHRKNYRLKFIILIMFIFPLAVSVKTYGEIKELSGDVEDEVPFPEGASCDTLKGINSAGIVFNNCNYLFIF